MSKPWEETWCMHPTDPNRVSHDPSENWQDERAPHATFSGAYFLVRDDPNARARFAAEAPAMWRLVARMIRSVWQDDCLQCCGSGTQEHKPCCEFARIAKAIGHEEEK